MNIRSTVSGSQDPGAVQLAAAQQGAQEAHVVARGRVGALAAEGQLRLRRQVEVAEAQAAVRRALVDRPSAARAARRVGANVASAIPSGAKTCSAR